MKIRILSDLHLEIKKKEKQNFNLEYFDEDVLILAGDIGTSYQIKHLCKNYLQDNPQSHIIFISGNHELYNESIKNFESQMKKIKIPNFYYLQKKNVTINGINFIGCTLWSDIPSNNFNLANYMMNDYKFIKIDDKTKFTPIDSVSLHHSHTKWIKEQIETINDPIVVITHHLPSFRSINKKYENNPVNCCFATNLDNIIIDSKIKLWIHGHSHCSVDYNIGNTRIVSNPRGYDYKTHFENDKFKKDFIVEI